MTPDLPRPEGYGAEWPEVVADVRAALESAGYAVVRLPEITPGPQLLPGADHVRELVSGEVVGRPLAPGTVFEDYVGVWPGELRWLGSAEARDRGARLIAVADAVECLSRPAEPEAVDRG